MGACTSTGAERIQTTAQRVLPLVQKGMELELSRAIDAFVLDSSGLNSVDDTVCRLVESVVPLVFLSNTEETAVVTREDSVLAVAVHSDHVEVIRYLCGYRPLLVTVGPRGGTPLHDACAIGVRGAVLRALLGGFLPFGAARLPSDTRRESVELRRALDMRREGDGDTPLHVAARNHFGWLCEVLMAAGADPHRHNFADETSLDAARAGGCDIAHQAAKPWWDGNTMSFAYVHQVLCSHTERRRSSVRSA